MIAGYDGDDLYVDDESATPHVIGTEEFGAAWTAHRKGRHQMIVPTGPPAGEPDVAGAIATTVAHLTGPVLGHSFDANFGFSGMDKLAGQLRDATTKTGWERRFGAPVPFFHGVRRLYECLELEYTAPGATRPLYADFLEQAEMLAIAYDAPSAEQRRALFDEMADLVASCAATERRAVETL